MAHIKEARQQNKGTKAKAPVKEGSVVLTNKDLFSKFDLELRSPDKILEHEGFDYYDKMLSTDAHVYSIINTRKMGAGSFPYTLKPKNDSPEALEQALFIKFLLDEIPIENHFFDILDAIPKGFSIHEIVTIPTDENHEFQDKIIINRLIFHPQQNFIFKVKPKTGYDLYFKSATFAEEKKLPSQNFLHANFDSNSPYGKPLLEKLYWYYWFKKETGFKFWAIFLEKFGGPTAIMKYPSGDTSTGLQEQANAALEDLQNSSGISLPDSFSLDFAKVSQGDISYQNMIDACNAEMSKAALGATQTVEEGRRGSYALSRTHTDVRAEYKLHDVRILRRAIQPQIIDRFIRLNFADPLPPTITFIIPGDDTTLDKPDPDHKGSVRDDESLNLSEHRRERRRVVKYGGPGSGHFDHEGRKGVVGGSKTSGGGSLSARGRSNAKGKDVVIAKVKKAATSLNRKLLNIGANALAIGPGAAMKELKKRGGNMQVVNLLNKAIEDANLPLETLTTLKIIKGMGLATIPSLIEPIKNLLEIITGDTSSLEEFKKASAKINEEILGVLPRIESVSQRDIGPRIAVPGDETGISSSRAMKIVSEALGDDGVPAEVLSIAFRLLTGEIESNPGAIQEALREIREPDIDKPSLSQRIGGEGATDEEADIIAGMIDTGEINDDPDSIDRALDTIRRERTIAELRK